MPQLAAQRRQRPGVPGQRKRILAVAVGLFAASGTAAVSVSAISKAAGVSRDTFYRCFDNKDQLIAALYRQSVSANMLAVTAAPEADFTDPQWLRQTIDETVDAILAEHEVARFLFLESADPGSPAHTVIVSAFNRVAKSMQRWCRSRWNYAPSRDCFTGLLSAAQWLVYNAINRGMTPGSVASAKRAIEELFLAVFVGLESRAGPGRGDPLS